MELVLELVEESEPSTLRDLALLGTDAVVGGVGSSDILKSAAVGMCQLCGEQNSIVGRIV
jgi:hypothetical protein